MKTVEDTIKELIATQLGVPLSDVQSDKKFVDDLGADSLDTVELVLTIEDEFNIEVQEDDAEGCDTVQKIIELVERLKK